MIVKAAEHCHCDDMPFRSGLFRFENILRSYIFQTIVILARHWDVRSKCEAEGK
jgi:hypothetical protein